MANKMDKMSDKERIYAYLIRQLHNTMLKLTTWAYEYPDNMDDWNVRFERIPYSDPSNVKEGDLVLALSGHISPVTVGFVHKVVSSDNIIVREIGTGNLCDYSNEMFVIIRNTNPDILYDGDERRLYEKISKAYAKLYWDHYGHIVYRIDIHGRDAIIWIREKWGGWKDGQRSVPYFIHLHWNKKTTIKSIMAHMVEQGYGKTEFQYVGKDDDWTLAYNK